MDAAVEVQAAVPEESAGMDAAVQPQKDTAQAVVALWTVLHLVQTAGLFDQLLELVQSLHQRAWSSAPETGTWFREERWQAELDAGSEKVEVQEVSEKKLRRDWFPSSW